MKRNREDTLKRYAMFLKELYDLSKAGAINVRAKDICLKYGINNNAYKQCFHLGILKDMPDGVIWVVGEPSLKLAEQLIKRCATYQNTVREKTKKKKQILNFESKENFEERKKVCEPYLSDMNDDFNKVVLETLVENILIAYGFKKPRLKRRLKWRNPFYWEIK